MTAARAAALHQFFKSGGVNVQQIFIRCLRPGSRGMK
jgi:hypothetical protein